MNEETKNKIKNVVCIFFALANRDDEDTLNNVIDYICSLNDYDAMDYIIISINDLVQKKSVTIEDVLANIDLLTDIVPDKYSTKEDILNRLHFLKSMNMEHPSMPLSKNQELALLAFDSFNKLIGTKFDAYYLGGLMGYIATDHKLVRYHSDLDLFINEDELETLCELISTSDDFKFVSNMEDKEVNGHEFKVQYKDTPMSVGLFLFERKKDGSMVTKEYYHKNKDINSPLLVDEHYKTKEYVDMVFKDQIRYHNGIPYKMQSLESIYNSKKGSRPKDKYDASIIEEYIDLNIDKKIDLEKENNHDVLGVDATNSIVAKFEKKTINEQKVL